eukprot:scaffold22953_cov96-Isochrysis_galbana.AAC.1
MARERRVCVAIWSALLFRLIGRERRAANGKLELLEKRQSSYLVWPAPGFDVCIRVRMNMRTCREQETSRD